MFVHNSEHNSSINSDQDDGIQYPITRISKLDISDLLHLHPNDSTALTVVSIKLKGTENYQVWSCAMLLALEGKNKIGFIDGSCKRSNTDEVLGKQWDRVNAIVLGWILNSISEELFMGKFFSKKPKHVWEELKETYDKVDGSIMFGLHNKINTFKQNDSAIVDYYHKLNALWKQYDAMIEFPKYVRNASEEVLPDVRSAYATISSEESHRVAVGSLAVLNLQDSSSSSSVYGSNNNTADFPVDCGNDADSSDDLVATQNEVVAKLEENVFSEGNLDQNLSSSHGVQNVRRSSRQSVF
ncbi:ribonuclease H-like domain-containing protein [Tanacetum coccineum]